MLQSAGSYTSPSLPLSLSLQLSLFLLLSVGLDSPSPEGPSPKGAAAYAEGRHASCNLSINLPPISPLLQVPLELEAVTSA